MERYEFTAQYTHETNTDLPTTIYADSTSLMFKLSSIFENSVTKVGGTGD